MRIYFIRHGDKQRTREVSAFGYSDQPLNELGIRQANITAEHLHQIRLDAVYASDLVRAQQTAEIIASYQQNVYVQTDARLREIDMGVFHTLTREEVQAQYPQFYQVYQRRDTDYTYPGGENGEQAAARMLSFLHDLIKQPYENAAVVCHGGIIHSIFCYFLGMPQHQRFKIKSSNCGISRLDYSDGFKIHSINETGHLLGVE